jgi:hypothetical protein
MFTGVAGSGYAINHPEQRTWSKSSQKQCVDNIESYYISASERGKEKTTARLPVRSDFRLPSSVLASINNLAAIGREAVKLSDIPG